MSIKRVIISGGGTGGHIYPAISIANAMKEIDSSIEFLFVGAEGMYNLVEHSEERSTFPSQKARELYGLATEEESKNASAFYNLREDPPITLLLHGDADVLCHYTQSIKFAEEIKSKGGEAKVLLHKNINHTTLNPSIPDVFKESVLEIANLFIDGFKLDKNTESLKNLLDKFFDFCLVVDVGGIDIFRVINCIRPERVDFLHAADQVEKVVDIVGFDVGAFGAKSQLSFQERAFVVHLQGRNVDVGRGVAGE